jgi:hypothetical protein
MKSICSILVMVLALHSFCGVDCVKAAFGEKSHTSSSGEEEAKCHEHAPHDAPATSEDHDSSEHSGDNSCAQAQAFEAKQTPTPAPRDIDTDAGILPVGLTQLPSIVCCDIYADRSLGFTPPLVTVLRI